MKKHIVFLLVTIFGWLFFYLIGLPYNYFIDIPSLDKILILLLIMFSFFPFLTFIIVSFLKGDYFINSLWFSLYASFGIFLLDFIVVGVISKAGLIFLKTHWLQTLGYIEALFIIPLTGFAIKKYGIRNNQNI